MVLWYKTIESWKDMKVVNLIASRILTENKSEYPMSYYRFKNIIFLIDNEAESVLGKGITGLNWEKSDMGYYSTELNEKLFKDSLDFYLDENFYGRLEKYVKPKKKLKKKMDKKLKSPEKEIVDLVIEKTNNLSNYDIVSLLVLCD